MVDDKTKSLYEVLSKDGYNVGSYENFTKNIQDEGKRKSLYDAISADYSVGDYDSFSASLIGKQDDVSVQAPAVPENPAPFTMDAKVRDYVLANKPGWLEPQPLATAPLGPDYTPLEDTEKRFEVAEKVRPYMIKEQNKGALRTLEGDLSALRNDLTAKMKAEKDDSWNLPAMRSDVGAALLRQTKSHKYESKEALQLQNVEYAEKLLDKSKRLLEEGENPSTSFMQGFGRGFSDSMSDLDKWTMGWSDLENNLRVQDIVRKIEKGHTLDASEQAVMDAMVTNAATEMLYREGLGRGYKAGEVTGESLPFMLDMIGSMGVIQSTTRPLSRAMMKYATSKLRQMGVKSGSLAMTSGRGLAHLGSGATNLALHTATAGAPRVAADYAQRGIGQTEIDFKPSGNAVYKGQSGRESGASAFGKAVISTAAETGSELLGEKFMPLLGYLGRVTGVNKIGNLIPKRIGELASDIASNPAVKEVMGFAKAAKISDPISEYAEEVVNNLVSVGIGDMSIDQLTDINQNIDTFLGVAPISVLFGGAGAGAYIRSKYKVNKEMKNFERKMSENHGEDWTEIRNALQNSTIEEARNFVKDILSRNDLSKAEKKDMVRYVYANMQEQTLSSSDVVVNPEEIEANKREIFNAYQVASKRVPFLTDEDKEKLPMMSVEEIESMDMPDDVKDRVVEYKAALEDYNRYIELTNARVQRAREQAIAQVEELTNYSTGTVMRVKSGFSENPVHILRGKVTFNDKGDVDASRSDKVIYYMTEDGSVKMGSTSMIQELIDETDASALAEQAANDAQADVEAQETAETSPVEVDTTIQSGDTSYYVQAKNPDGTYLVSITTPQGEQISQMTEQQLQDLITTQQAVQVDEMSQQTAESATTTQNVESTVQNRDADNVSNFEETLPRDDKGNFDFAAFTPQQAYQYTAKMSGEDVAREDLQADVNNLQAEIDKLTEQAKKAQGGKRIQIRQEIADKMNQLNSMTELLNSVTPAETVQEAAQEEVPQKIVQEEVQAEPTAYEDMDSYDTLADLNKDLSEEEVDAFVANNIKEYESQLGKVKAPKIGTDKAAYLEEKKAVEAEKAEIQRKIDYWKGIQGEITEMRSQIGEKEAQEILSQDEPQTAEEYAALKLGGGAIKLNRDSYLKETGYGNEEAKKMFGLFSKDGVSIERAGEMLEREAREDGYNFFAEGDVNAGLAAVLNVLSEARTRGDLINYIKNRRQAQAERQMNAERAYYEDMIERNFNMTAEEYEQYVEVAEREIGNRMLSEEDYNEFMSYFADETLNETEDGRKETDIERSEAGGEVLQGEQPDNAGGSEQTETEPTEVDGRGDNTGDVAPEEVEPTPTQQAIQQAESEVNTEPTEGQKEAGNYKTDINSIKLEEDEQTEENAESVAGKVEAVANEAESRIEEARTEDEINDIVEQLDEQIEDVNKQLSELDYIDTLNSGMRVVLKDGRNVLLSVVMHSGEQISATQFSKPHVSSMYASYKGKLINIMPEDVDIDATIKYNTPKQESELAGDSSEYQDKASQEKKAVEQIGLLIREKALSAVDGNSTEPLSMKDVKKILGGYSLLSDMSPTDMQELVELAMTNETRKVALKYIAGNKQKFGYDLILAMYNAQPLLNARDSTRFERQQYSTPTPFGYVMGQFVQDGKQIDSVLEPSAGNGALTITFPSAIVHVNDIDDRRLANLRTIGYREVTNQDALVPFNESVDAVMTNPPFGITTTKEFDGGRIKINSLEGLMAINALESMKDDGRAAIVIGGNTSYRDNGAMQSKDMKLFSYLYTHYNVVDVINLDGDMYKRNGTKYDVRIILINGRKKDADKIIAPPVKSKARAEQVKTFEELYNRVQDDIHRIQQMGTIPSSTEGETESADGKGIRADGNVSNSSDTGERRGPGYGSEELGSENNMESTEKSAGESNERKRAETAEGLDNVNRPDKGNNGNVSQSIEPAERGGHTEGRASRAAGPDATDRGDNSGRSRLAVNLGDEKVAYPNRSQSGTLMSVVPANQAKVLADSLEDIGDVDQFLVNELGYSSKEELFGYLAAEQIDSVSLAINQMNKGNGFIIGDMTGVGKGRQGAALIRYAVRKGYKPIYFTQKPALFSDNYRDLADIGSGELRPFIIGSDPKNAAITDAQGNVIHKLPTEKERKRVYDYILKNGTLPDEYDYVITTYSQINNGTKEYEATKEGITAKDKTYKKKSPSPADKSGQERRDVLEALSKDNIMILDESHTAGGSGGGSMFMQYIMPRVKGVTFLSATFAKRADNMPIYAMKTDLAKSGITQQELIEAIAKGGVTLQEIMSKQLVQSGQMIRRERSFNGVTIDWLSVSDEEDAVQRKQFDEVSSIFSAIRSFQKEYVNPLVENRSEELAEEGGYSDLQRGTVDLGASNTPFASKMYNLVNQLLFSLKADAVANRVIENLKNGFKPVISFTNTMEGFLDEAPKDTPMDVVPNFSLTLLKALDGVMRYTETDIQGEKINKFYTPDELGEEGKKKYYEIKNKIEHLSANLPISPMDAIKTKIEEAGYKVGEITGRNLEMVRNEEGKYIVRNRKDKDKKSAARDFNNGQIDVLMINKSGSTGISLHASPKFHDQRQRVMVFAQFQSDINDEVQMRGRIDRTGQIYRGKYEYIMSSIPAEQRLQMMFKAKLKSLDANTTSSQKSKFNEMQVTDFLNKYGDEVVYQYMIEHPELSEKLGDPLNMLADNGSEMQVDETSKEKMKDSAAKIARYLPFLPVKEQEEVFKEITDAYAVKIQLLNDAGENDLEITTMPLKAKTLSRKIWNPGAEPNSGNAFADNTYIEEVEVDVLKKPMKSEEIKKESERLSEGKPFEQWIAEKKESVNKVYEDKVESLKAKLKKSTEERIAKAKETYIKKSKEARDKGKNEFTDDEIIRMSNVLAEDIKAKANEGFAKQKNAIDSRRDNVLKAMEAFEPMKPLIIPTNLEEETATIDLVRGMFVGFKFSKDYSPSSSTAVFATLDGRRKVEIPLKDSEAFGIIRMNTLMQPSYLQTLNIDTWDSFVPTQTRKRAYIVTGNLLQAIVDVKKSDKARGYLVSYSTEEGGTKQGILMSEGFQPSDLTTSVPIRSRLEQVRRGETVVSEDKRVVVEKNVGWRGGFSIKVPKSKKQGGEFFEDKVLRSLVNDKEFTSKGNFMVGEFGESSLPKLLDRLSNMGVKVSDKAKLKDAPSDVRFRSEREQGAVESTKLANEIANDTATKLGVPITVHDALDSVPEGPAKEAIKKGRKVKGWYDTKTGTVHVYMPNATSAEDVQKTILHEGVAHYGLRQLVGEGYFDDFLDEVFANVSQEVRGRIVSNLPKYGYNSRVATEEYMATLAENGVEPSVWNRIKQAFKELLRKVGIKVSISDNELKYILWRSAQNLRMNNPLDLAKDMAMQYNMGVGNYLREEKIGSGRKIKFTRKNPTTTFNAIVKMLEKEGIEPENISRAKTGSKYIEFGKNGVLYNIRAANHTKGFFGEYESDNGVSFDWDDNIYSVEIDLSRNEMGIEDIKGLMNVVDEINRDNKSLDYFMTNQYYPSDVYGLNAYTSIADEIVRRELINNKEYFTRQYSNEAEQTYPYKDFVASNGIEVRHNGKYAPLPKLPLGWKGKTKKPSEDAVNEYLDSKEYQENVTAYNKRNEYVNEKLRAINDKIEVRFREDDAIEAYNQSFNKKAYWFKEAWQDSMLALKNLQDVVAESSGEPIKDFENAYMAENQLSRLNKAQSIKFWDEYMQPLANEVAKMVSKDVSYQDIIDYLMLSHGIERNVEMSNRERINDMDEQDREAAYEQFYNDVKALRRQYKGYDYLKALTDYFGEVDDYSATEAVLSRDGSEHTDFQNEALERVREFEASNDVTALRKLVKAATDQSLRKTFESGMMGRDEYNRVKDMFAYYVPLRGWEGTKAEDVYDYMGDMNPVNSTLKKMKGRNSIPDDPIATIGNMGESAIVQGNRNAMKQKFYNMAVNHPTDLITMTKAWYAPNANGDMELSLPQIDETDNAETIAQKIKDHDELMKSIGATRKKQGLNISYPITSSSKTQHAVIVKIGGKDYVLYINGNPRAAQAINGLTNPDAENNPALKATYWLNRTLSALYTSKNPEFVVSNFMRDYIEACTVISAKEDSDYNKAFRKNMRTALVDVAKGFKGKLKGDANKYFTEFTENGGQMGYFSISDVNAYKKKLKKQMDEITGRRGSAKKALDYIWDSIEAVNKYAETVSRYATYRTSREMGRSIEQSIKDASDVTVNFSKKGSGFKAMGGKIVKGDISTFIPKAAGFAAGSAKMLYLFINPAIQSLANWGYIAKRNKKAIMGIVGGFALSGYVMPIINQVLWSLFGDDDRENPYNDLPEWIRRNNICIGVGTYLTIPLPHTLRAFYGMGEMSYQVSTGRKDMSPEKMTYEVASQLTALLPIDPLGNDGDIKMTLTPSYLRGMAEAYIWNEDFMGTPIAKITPYNENDPEWKRVYKGTAGWLVDTSKFFNDLSAGKEAGRDFRKGVIDFNPAKMEHIGESYFGGIWKFLNNAGKTIYYTGESLIEGEKSDDLVLRNVPWVRRFLATSDERTSFSGLNDKYYDLVDEMEQFKYELDGVKRSIKDDPEKYTWQYEELMKSDDYKKYKVYEGYRNALDNLYKISKSVSDEEKKQIENYSNGLKRQLLEELK